MDKKANIEITENYLYMLYKAEKTLWYFDMLIENKFSGYTAIKFKNDQGTYVWLENVVIEGDYYTGKLTEGGRAHTVLLNEVIDWMIVEGGRMIGGYTIRHYRDSIDDEAKINFDIDFGVKIDDGNDFFKPDFVTPEGAIIKIESFYSEENLDGVLSCKNFIQEAGNLLEEREVSITEGLEIKVAETLKSSFIESLESNGFPYFGGIERNFTLKEKLKDKHLIEEKVIYPDGTVTYNNLWVGHSNDGWKVLNNVE